MRLQCRLRFEFMAMTGMNFSLDCTSETAIAVGFLVMNLEKWPKMPSFSLFLLLRRYSFSDNGSLENSQGTLNPYQFAAIGNK
jgi:hypothetical protein